MNLGRGASILGRFFFAAGVGLFEPPKRAALQPLKPLEVVVSGVEKVRTNWRTM